MDSEENSLIKKEELNRPEWGNHCEYFLSSLGLAVGLGNVWRFPYICYTNGGGTFLIPYVIMLFTVAMPIHLMETAIGQYGGFSATKIFALLNPGFSGLGYAVYASLLTYDIYYMLAMAYSFYFLFVGLGSGGILPWSICDHDYNTIKLVHVSCF